MRHADRRLRRASDGHPSVEPGNTTRLAARVRAAGGPVDVRYYRGLSHGLLLGTIAAPLRFLAPVLRDVMGFIRAQVSPNSCAPGG